MTEAELIEKAAELDDYAWQVAATQVMWFHRKGAGDLRVLPEWMLNAGGLVTNPTDWARVRKRIASERQTRRRQASAAWRVASAERRREYMREYMRRYRKEL